MFSDSYKDMAAICLPNLRRYCDRHGYQLKEIRVEDDNAWFKKHKAFAELFDTLTEEDIIWCGDVDGLVMNHTIKIEDLINETHSFFITHDFNELNGGSVIIKANESGRKFNDLVLANRLNYPNEQNFYNDIYHDMPEIIKVLPQKAMNSYDYSLYHECKEYIGRPELGDFERGHFFIHFPGLSPENKLAMMQEFKEKIIYE